MPKLWVGIREPCVVDLIQHVRKSGIILITEKEDFPQFDEEKVQQESKELGVYILWKMRLMHLLLNPCWFYPLVDFIILDKFNEMVEQKCSLFLVSPKVIQELVQLSSVRVLILRHFKSWGWVFFNKGEWCREYRNSFVLFKFRSQLYFYY